MRNELVTAAELVQAIRRTKGQFFSITFVKKNGETRKLNCRLGVHFPTVGGDAWTKHILRYLTVWDAQLREYRTVNLNTVLSFIHGDTQYINCQDLA